MSTVRISELPVVSTLNDDDFIVVNTQNIVTQGIEAENFILSLFGRDITFTGTATFSKGVVFSDVVTYNENANFNDTVIFSDAVIFNGTTNLELSSLNDVEFVSVPLSGQVLTWSGTTGKWGAATPSAGGGTPGGNPFSLQFNDSGTFGGAASAVYGNTTSGDKGITIIGSTSNLQLSGGRVYGTKTLNVDSADGVIINSSEVKIQYINVDRIIADSTGVKLDGKVSATDLEVKTSFIANGITYPTTDGTAGQVVTTDGSGNLSFTTVSSGGGGGASIPFQPTAPAGAATGDLWLNSTTYKLYVYDGSWIATS